MALPNLLEQHAQFRAWRDAHGSMRFEEAQPMFSADLQRSGLLPCAVVAAAFEIAAGNPNGYSECAETDVHLGNAG